MLRKLGYAASEAGTLAEARERLLGQAHFFAILADLKLPDGEGHTLAKDARDRRQPIPLMVVTAYDEPEAINECFLQGIPFARKPEATRCIESFLERIAEADTDRGRRMARAVAVLAAERGLRPYE